MLIILAETKTKGIDIFIKDFIVIFNFFNNLLFDIIYNMSEFKYRFVNFILLVILGFGIYWAFNTIDNGITYDRNRDLVLDSSDLDLAKNNDVDSEEILFDNTKKDSNNNENIENVDIKLLSPEEEILLEKLQGLIDDKVYMKKGSRGTRVGTVQEFLNLYLKTDKLVDNDYGPGTMSDVRKFQENEDLDVDGLAGPDTYQKMIDFINS